MSFMFYKGHSIKDSIMDNSQNIKVMNDSEMSLSIISKTFVFGGNQHVFEAFKKTEKLASALFLVTQYIPQEERLRSALRDKSIALLSTCAVLRTLPQYDSDHTKNKNDEQNREALAIISEIDSLLSIARTARYISDMNAEILQKEYYTLAQIITTEAERPKEKRTNGPELTDEFFRIPELLETYPKGHLKGQNEHSLKDMSFRNTVSKPHENNVRKERHSSPSSQDQQEKKKHYSAGALVRHGRRRESILTLLKNKPNLSVKDVSQSVPQVSEKTLQRELLSMVSEGILQKRGERRWSTYSLT